MFDNSNEMNASFPYKKASINSSSLIEQRAGDFAEPSISTIQRVDQSVSTITKNDEVSFTSNTSNRIPQAIKSGSLQNMRKAVSHDQTGKESPQKGNISQMKQDINASYGQNQIKSSGRKIAGYFSQTNQSQSAKKRESIQIEDQQLGVL